MPRARRYALVSWRGTAATVATATARKEKAVANFIVKEGFFGTTKGQSKEWTERNPE